MPDRVLKDSDLTRFYFYVDIQPGPDGCWLWDGPLYKNGYAYFQTYGAHRASWIFHRGRIPSKMQVLHKCDVRHCVNPDHLFLGLPVDNTADMLRKGRDVRGCKSPLASIKDPKVILKIRSLLASGMTRSKVAKKLNVLYCTVYCIDKNISYTVHR